MKKFLKNENGDYVIEASIVLTIVMVFIFFLLMLGFYLYQGMCVNVVANDTASSIAAIYGYETKDPLEGFVSENDYAKTDAYRHIINSAKNIVTGRDENQKKAIWYTLSTLDLQKYIAPANPPQASVTIKLLTPFKTQINVEVTAEYEVPLAGMLARISGGAIDDKITFKGTGSAICTDISEYKAKIDFFAQLLGVVSKNGKFQTINKDLNQIWEDLDKMIELFNKLK